MLVLGDLLHAPAGLERGMVERVAAWRREVPLDLELVPGNHDGSIRRVVEAWNVRLHDPVLEEEGLRFVHNPAEPSCAAGSGACVAGHLHPAVTLRGNGDRLRLPCFWGRSVAGSELLVMPAFSTFTGGVSIRPDATDRVWAVADRAVVEL